MLAEAVSHIEQNVLTLPMLFSNLAVQFLRGETPPSISFAPEDRHEESIRILLHTNQKRDSLQSTVPFISFGGVV